MQQQILILDRAATPTGPILLVTDEMQRLRALHWENCEARLHRTLSILYGRSGIQLARSRAPSNIRTSLQQYFEGDLNALDGILVETAGTSFQRAVWRELRRIPVGTTASYSALAARIGRSSAVRAVGHANGSNPICIVVPCHRVVGADGSLTGFGGGLDRKQWLLTHEGAAFGSSPMRRAKRHAEANAHA